MEDDTALLRSFKRALAHPGDALFHLWKQVPLGSFRWRLDFDLFDRPHYAYCLYQAAVLARALGMQRASAIEFGVAGGRGLLALEKLAAQVTKETGVSLELYGFDLGTGLPDPVDHRDLPYAWQARFFDMDAEALADRLSFAQLVLGDVSATVGTFFTQYRPAPVGFVAFDLDYYSSTVASLRIFDADDEHLLPRIWCYFDDIVGPDQVLHCDRVGQLLAIREFNERHPDKTLAPVNGLRHKRLRGGAWCDSIYALHSFDHRLYNAYIAPAGPTQLPL